MLRRLLTGLAGSRARPGHGLFVHDWDRARIVEAVARHLAEEPCEPGSLRTVVVEHAPGEGGRMVEDPVAFAVELELRRPDLRRVHGSGAALVSDEDGATLQMAFWPGSGIHGGMGRITGHCTPLRPPDDHVTGLVRFRGGVGPRLEAQLGERERRHGIVGYWPGWGPLRVEAGPAAHFRSDASPPFTLTLRSGRWIVDGAEVGTQEDGASLSIRLPDLTLVAEALPNPMRLRHALALAGLAPTVVLGVAGRLPPPEGSLEIASGIWLSAAHLMVHQVPGVRVNRREMFVGRVPLEKLRKLEIPPGLHPYGPERLVASWDSGAGMLRFRGPSRIRWHLNEEGGAPQRWEVFLRRRADGDATVRGLELPFGDPLVPRSASLTAEPLPMGSLRVAAEGVQMRIRRGAAGERWTGLGEGEYVQIFPGSEFAVGSTVFRVDTQSGRGAA